MTDPREIAAEGTTMITQADREAAWIIRPSCYQSHEKTKWMSGVYDEVHVIRAVARHRIAEREAVVKWLREREAKLLDDASDQNEEREKRKLRHQAFICAHSATLIEAGEHVGTRLNPGYVNQPIAENDTPGEYKLIPPTA